MKNTGIELIAIERKEQVEKHGRTVEKDIIFNSTGQLLMAAKYCLFSYPRTSDYPKDWSFDFKVKLQEKTKIEKLVLAAALIAAEIDRLQSIENEN